MISKLLALKNHTGFKKYFFNTTWLFAEQALRILSGLFVGVWVARYLGPNQYGIFSYAFAFTSIFSGLAKLGLDEILVRELVNHPERRDKYLGTAFWLKIFGAFIVMGIMAAIVPFTSNDATTNLFIFIIASTLLFQSFELVDFYFQSQVQARIITICKVIQLILSSIIKILLILTKADLTWFVLATSFDAISLAISYFIAYRLRENSSFFQHFDLKIAKKLLKDSWPLIFTSIVVSIYMRIDQIMIKEILGEYEVGIYSVAVRLSEAFYFIPMLITSSLFPAILNVKKQSEDLYKQRLQKLYTFMVWFAIAIALPMTFFSNNLIILLFGKAYIAAGKVLMINIWASIFVFLGVSFSKYLLAENLTKITFQRTFIGAISNILLNLWLIPIYGISGAALATLSAQFIANFGYDIFDKRLHKQLVMKTKAILMPWKIITG
jgi:O-antigen/teichoic acid export membrane protein